MPAGITCMLEYTKKFMKHFISPRYIYKSYLKDDLISVIIVILQGQEAR